MLRIVHHIISQILHCLANFFIIVPYFLILKHAELTPIYFLMLSLGKLFLLTENKVMLILSSIFLGTTLAILIFYTIFLLFYYIYICVIKPIIENNIIDSFSSNWNHLSICFHSYGIPHVYEIWDRRIRKLIGKERKKLPDYLS